MLRVNYPPIYRSYTKRFAFSGGLVPLNSMQTAIENFRSKTGGNLAKDSVQYLQNASLVYNNDSSPGSSALSRRWLDTTFPAFVPVLHARATVPFVNGSTPGNTTGFGTNGASPDGSKLKHVVYGIQGYVEQLSIPQANTFMTVLLVCAIVIAVIAVVILLFKVILETWALLASFPKSLGGFRKGSWYVLCHPQPCIVITFVESRDVFGERKDTFLPCLFHFWRVKMPFQRSKSATLTINHD